MWCRPGNESCILRLLWFYHFVPPDAENSSEWWAITITITHQLPLWLGSFAKYNLESNNYKANTYQNWTALLTYTMSLFVMCTPNTIHNLPLTVDIASIVRWYQSDLFLPQVSNIQPDEICTDDWIYDCVWVNVIKHLYLLERFCL